jgi:hypothetical protein
VLGKGQGCIEEVSGMVAWIEGLALEFEHDIGVQAMEKGKRG